MNFRETHPDQKQLDSEYVPEVVDKAFRKRGKDGLSNWKEGAILI